MQLAQEVLPSELADQRVRVGRNRVARSMQAANLQV